MTNKLTVVICSNRLEKVEKYSLKKLLEITDIEFNILLILDRNTSNLNNDYLESVSSNTRIILSNRTGLSGLRNQALEECKTDYILFIDDDVEIDSNGLKEVIKNLDSGIDIYGLRLILGNNKNLSKRWYLTDNQKHYIAIHSDLEKKAVWGACMSFNKKNIDKYNVTFSEKLERVGNKLISGEDTHFINTLIKLGFSRKLDEEKFVLHYVDKNRFKFTRLTSRIFSQGRSEIKRNNFFGGLIKEFARNFRSKSFSKIIIGLFWCTIFVWGNFYEIINKLVTSLKRKQVLFICTGNYYRSRYAEIYFNEHIKLKNKKIKAISRGMWLDNPENVGPMSINAEKQLIKDGIDISGLKLKYPKLLSYRDLRKSYIVIALDDKEHRSMFSDKYPKYDKDVLFWNAKDVAESTPDESLLIVKNEVKRLIDNI